MHRECVAYTRECVAYTRECVAYEYWLSDISEQQGTPAYKHGAPRYNLAYYTCDACAHLCVHVVGLVCVS